ncbi:MAG: GvpL/GvpF family gas vesicle protein [Chloroflexi bacterium]|nr:GvpL/GvpF family gas vesicle protein [Chloroflexota bacterium]
MSQITASSASARDTSLPLCESWRYLYGIISTNDDLVFEIPGVDDSDGEVFNISRRGLAAVVSDAARADYNRMTRQEAVTRLVAHQRVIETVMRDLPILPVKFGTVLPDETRVYRLLAQGERLFRAALQRFAGHVQMEVVVLWNRQEVFQSIALEEPIAQRKAQLAGRPLQENMAEWVAFGQMVQASLERRRTALHNEVLPPLREIGQDAALNPLMDDGMVANVALLVDRAGRAALDRRLEELDKRFEGRYHFRCVGPLPPYSFVTVEVAAPSFEAVDDARRRLGLGETVAPEEIKRAYRRLAVEQHPDRARGDPEAEARMTALTQAYRLLTAYAESRWQVADGKSPMADRPSAIGHRLSAICDFSREAAEGTLLIALRRQETRDRGAG